MGNSCGNVTKAEFIYHSRRVQGLDDIRNIHVEYRFLVNISVRQEVLDFTCRDVILKRWHQCLEFETSSSGIEKRIARKIENRYGWKDEIEKNDG